MNDVARRALEDLRRIPGFAAAPEHALLRMLATVDPLLFQAGDVLIQQSETGDFALLLLSGQVDVQRQTQHGTASVGRIAAPAMVGEIGALAGIARTASLIALEPCVTLRVRRPALEELGRETPDLLVSVIGTLGQQIQNTNEALGLFAGGLAALERDELDAGLLDDLKHPSPQLAAFARAFDGLAHRITVERRSRNELASAALIQRAMLPGRLDEAIDDPRCRVFGAMQPARDVGGDLYDAFMLDDDRLAMAVGDVCGKGVPAALFMCVTVTVLRLAAREYGGAPGEVIPRINSLLCAGNEAGMFSTLFYGVLDLRTRELEYVSCGHNPAFRIGAGHAELSGGGPPVGIAEHAKWTPQTVVLQPGDGLFVYTDGVTETETADGEPYGEARLSRLLQAAAGASPETLVAACMADVARFAEAAEPFDDITCLAVTVS